jgi:hypothetical protein
MGVSWLPQQLTISAAVQHAGGAYEGLLEDPSCDDSRHARPPPGTNPCPEHVYLVPIITVAGPEWHSTERMASSCQMACDLVENVANTDAISHSMLNLSQKQPCSLRPSIGTASHNN